MSALLVNESQGGFAVLVDRPDGLKIGKKVELRTNMGWFMVRVVYINKAARPINAAPGCDSWFQAGVRIKQRLQPGRLLR